MHPIKFSYTPAELDADGIALAGTAGTAGVAFVLRAAFIAGGYLIGDGLAHTITIAPSGSVTGNYTITGTNADGVAQTETLATNTVNTVTSTLYWRTVTSILAPSGIGAETVTIGWTGVAVGPTFPLNWRQTNFQVSLGLALTGTINVTVQHTFDDLHGGYATPFTSWTWWPHATLVTKTSSADGNYAFPVTATRLLINSVSAGATVAFFVDQGR